MMTKRQLSHKVAHTKLSYRLKSLEIYVPFFDIIHFF